MRDAPHRGEVVDVLEAGPLAPAPAHIWEEGVGFLGLHPRHAVRHGYVVDSLVVSVEIVALRVPSLVIVSYNTRLYERALQEPVFFDTLEVVADRSDPYAGARAVVLPLLIVVDHSVEVFVVDIE